MKRTARAIWQAIDYGGKVMIITLLSLWCITAFAIYMVGKLGPVVKDQARAPVDQIECPPYHQCTPKGMWNAPGCDCWEDK